MNKIVTKIFKNHAKSSLSDFIRASEPICSPTPLQYDIFEEEDTDEENED